MSVKYFVDTNVLVYAFDHSAAEKQQIARDWIARQGAVGNLVLSTQVLQEFFVTVTRKLSQPLEISQAGRVVESLAHFPLVTITPKIIHRTIHRHQDASFSFWDSLIVEAAIEGKTDVLLSEDIQDGRKIDAMLLKNPFVVA